MTRQRIRQPPTLEIGGVIAAELRQWLVEVHDVLNGEQTDVFSDEGTPSPSLGIEGDLYVDTTTRTVYAKTSSGWVA